MTPIKSTGRCTTTHNACDCVLERLRKLEAIKDAAKVVKEESYIHSCGDDSFSILKPLLDKLHEALSKYEREEGTH
jgi:hypothetical protein